jgi:hypothetical protein
MGRYKVDFVDDLVRDISTSCQKWIDRHFSLAYAIKSLYKIAPQHEREHLMAWMVAHRQISLLLLKVLTYIFDEEDDGKKSFVQLEDCLPQSAVNNIEALRSLTRSSKDVSRMRIGECCMNLLDKNIAEENNKIERLLNTGEMSDAKDGLLLEVLRRWKEQTGIWILINGPDKITESQECGV